MRLIPDGEKVRLCDMEPGLFMFGDCLALKTEYITESGRIEAYIVDTGELFHGGANTAAEQRALMVQPLKVAKRDHKREAPYWATEQAYKNGYEKGYKNGRNDAVRNKRRKEN